MELLKVLSPVVYDRTHLYQGCFSFSFYTNGFFASNVFLRFIKSKCNLIISSFSGFRLMTTAILFFHKTARRLVHGKQIYIL